MVRDWTCSVLLFAVFFFKQKTAYEMRISDWSSDVCSSDLKRFGDVIVGAEFQPDHAIHRIALGGQHHDWQGANGCRVRADLPAHVQAVGKIGRASCRERVCQYV